MKSERSWYPPTPDVQHRSIRKDLAKGVRRIVTLLVGALTFLPSRYMPQQAVRWQNQIWGTLSVTIVDDDTRRPVPARCYLTDRAGRNWTPSGVISYVKPPEVDFIAPGKFEISLPRGTYVLQIMRGTEYRRITKEIEIHAGDIRDERFHLQRWINMKARGWYSGDLHNHRPSQEMTHILLSEDLAPTLTNWVRDENTNDSSTTFGCGSALSYS